MKHAFLIMAHNNWEQLKKLLFLLDDSRNAIYLHIDKKSHGYESLRYEKELKRATLEVIPKYRISWGGVSQIQCTLSLIRHALQSDSEYYHLISGMDLPLHNMDYIDNFFSAHQNMEFVHFSEREPGLCESTRNRIALYHPFQELLGRKCGPVEFTLANIQKILGVDRLKNIHYINLAKGANWFSVTKNFARYVIDKWPIYRKIFSSSYCADEIFLQTILINSPYRDNIYHPEVDDDYSAIMRLIDWERGTPYIFRTDDFPLLANSSMLFARKFDEKKIPILSI